ncbi:type VI secretion system baseplate subunit TssF [Vibrio chagasii]|uniref:Type VI secretion system baseplate subunit TssF n=1 Tax=Vibrio chagasii TaxID=170679 RepID=A0A7Y4DSY6_9VIBR|nr:type VI secretion system baseplate subunit TssF [Vibrio chagasii]NOH34931.1 type VI secretion system baseplate subunit TssF [Vibrio chagasii]
MTEPIMRYFEQELAFVRRSLGQFGQEYPTHAEKLNIHQGKIEDPSMARLLDGVALLNAKVEKKLSEQLPEVIEGILGVLYPSYIQTVPSVAYLELLAEDGPIESSTLPKGSLFSSSNTKNECLFRTVDELKISPFSLSNIKALSAPFSFNRPKSASQSNAVVQISLSTGDPETHFSHLELNDLDFFVKGFENNADSLVELLLNNTLSISISDSECAQHVTLDSHQLKNRISDLEFKFLPEHGNQFTGYQLINEFFFFKEKRQFFRLKNFAQYASQFDESEIVINLFMSSLPSEFIRLFNKDVIKLNVMPAVNLFEQTGEPISYDHRTLSVPVNADAHSDNNIEIIEIQDVYEITPNGEIPLVPLFKEKYAHTQRYDYWQSKHNHFGEMSIAISLSDTPTAEFSKLLGTRLLCTNGKQACGVSGTLECLESIDLPGDFSPIYPPSAPITKEVDQNVHWEFISLLNTNFSSLVQSSNPVADLKHMLSLCSREQVSSAEIQMIHSITFNSQVSAIRVLGKNVFSPGTEIELTLDATGPYLAFADVLNRFFQQFCSFDRYIQLKIRIYGRDGIVKKYPKIHGSQLCL